MRFRRDDASFTNKNLVKSQFVARITNPTSTSTPNPSPQKSAFQNNGTNIVSFSSNEALGSECHSKIDSVSSIVRLMEPIKFHLIQSQKMHTVAFLHDLEIPSNDLYTNLNTSEDGKITGSISNTQYISELICTEFFSFVFSWRFQIDPNYMKDGVRYLSLSLMLIDINSADGKTNDKKELPSLIDAIYSFTIFDYCDNLSSQGQDSIKKLCEKESSFRTFSLRNPSERSYGWPKFIPIKRLGDSPKSLKIRTQITLINPNTPEPILRLNSPTVKNPQYFHYPPTQLCDINQNIPPTYNENHQFFHSTPTQMSKTNHTIPIIDEIPFPENEDIFDAHDYAMDVLNEELKNDGVDIEEIVDLCYDIDCMDFDSNKNDDELDSSSNLNSNSSNLNSNSSNLNSNSNSSNSNSSYLNSSNESNSTSACTNSSADESQILATFSEVIKELWVTMQGWDICFSAENKLFHAHYSVISARSRVFKSKLEQLSQELTDKKFEIILNEDDESAIFYKLLEFCYTNQYGKILNFEQLSKLYVMANRYKVIALKKSIIDNHSHELSLSTVVPTLILVKRCSIEPEIWSHFQNIALFIQKNLNELLSVESFIALYNQEKKKMEDDDGDGYEERGSLIADLLLKF